MLDKLKKINIITGHYGSGKTNLAVNLAVMLKRSGRDVVIADLDIVNPYFRTADFIAGLEAAGIEVSVPMFANTNLDVAGLSASTAAVFEAAVRGKTAIIDVGGDDAGATALGRYSSLINASEYEHIFVINKYRYLTKTAEEAVQLLREIEAASRVKATAIANNSNFSFETTPEDIKNSLDFAAEVCDITGLPLMFTAYDRRLEGLLGNIPNGLAIERYVKLPWETNYRAMEV